MIRSDSACFRLCQHARRSDGSERTPWFARLAGIARAALAVAVLALSTGCGDATSESLATTPPGAPSRVVRHVAGETTIVGTPTRIVALAPLAIESLLAIGVRPVGVTAYAEGGANNPLAAYPPYLAQELEGISTIGGGFKTPSLEAILALSPDLIVGTTYHLPAYDVLAGIAPTILLDQENAAESKEERGWRQSLRILGRAFGREEQAERRIAEYDEAVVRARERLSASVGDHTVLVARMMAKGFTISGPSHGTTGDVLYSDLGLRPPKGSDVTWNKEQVPLEQLAALDADRILVIEASESQTENPLRSEPLWKSLRAVRNGHARSVGFFWIRGHGWYGKMAIVEQAANVLSEPR